MGPWLVSLLVALVVVMVSDETNDRMERNNFGRKES